jgi:hypothetical protein
MAAEKHSRVKQMTAAQDSEIDLDQYTDLQASYQFHGWA